MDLVTNLQSSKEVVPAVAAFDHPAPGFVARILLALGFFLTARLDMGNVPAPRGGATNLGIIIALVITEVLRHFPGRWPTDHDGVQRGVEHFHVVPVRAREGDGQANAIGIGERMQLGAQFAPIGRVFSGLVPPFTGVDTVALSIDWKRKSMPWRSS